MKIYIETYKLTNIINKYNILDNYLYSEKQQIEIYSEEGIFVVDNSKVFKLKIIDKPPYKIEVKGNHLLIDESIIEKEINYQVPPEHITIHSTTFTYKINPKINLFFVIEGTYNKKQSNDKYSDFEPTNLYFTSSSTINEIKDTLCVFLSLLN